jgi:cell pole-organizing protein PopZ
MRQNGEPSVEEILQSIKQVIARDSRLDVRPNPAARPLRGDPLLDAAPEPDEDDVLELHEAAQLPAQPEPGDEGEDGSLVQPQARNSMRESLAALAMLSEPGAQPQIVRSGETSLEALTRELLRPALAEWLDRNLPPMVERLVAAEIARIVGKKV